MINIKKIALGILSLIVIAWWIYAYTQLGWVEETSANPDFICVKEVTNQACETTSCTEWRADWTRTCTWTAATSVYYELTRTTCEAGYTRIATWRSVWGASWRRTPDMTYTTDTCSIVQTDHTAPVGAGG